MTHKWQILASLAQEICTLWFQFFGAVFAYKGYPFKNNCITEKASMETEIDKEMPDIKRGIIEDLT